MNLEQFSLGDSLLHRADPRVKIIAAVLFTLTIALSRHFSTALAGLLIGTALIPAARLSARKVIRRLLLVNTFNFLLFLLLPLTYGGEPTVSCGGIVVSQPGFLLAALITVKANAISLIFISLLATSSAARTGHGLQELHVSGRLCVLLLFSYRYIGVIQEEFERLYRAARLRGFQPGSNLHTYRTFAYMLGMLLVKSWNRAARIRESMALRGFSGRFHSLHALKMTRNDHLLCTALLSGFLGLLANELIQQGRF